jgi:hypothetical protein
MSLLQSNFDNQICMWDVAQDGGAVGMIPLGLIIPQRAFITGIWAIGGILTGGAGAKVSFGYRTLDQSPVITSPTEFFPAAGVGSYGFQTGSPDSITFPIEICAFVTTAAFTSGRVTIFTYYFNHDLSSI